MRLGPGSVVVTVPVTLTALPSSDGSDDKSGAELCSRCDSGLDFVGAGAGTEANLGRRETIAVGFRLWIDLRIRTPAMGRELASVSFTTSGLSSLLPTGAACPLPPTAVRAAGDPSSGRVRLPPPQPMRAVPRTG